MLGPNSDLPNTWQRGSASILLAESYIYNVSAEKIIAMLGRNGPNTVELISNFFLCSYPQHKYLMLTNSCSHSMFPCGVVKNLSARQLAVSYNSDGKRRRER